MSFNPLSLCFRPKASQRYVETIILTPVKSVEEKRADVITQLNKWASTLNVADDPYPEYYTAEQNEIWQHASDLEKKQQLDTELEEIVKPSTNARRRRRRDVPT